MVSIETGFLGLRGSAAVVIKRPFPRGSVGKATAFQILHCVKAAFLGGFPFFTLCPPEITSFWAALASKDYRLVRREIGFFRLMIFAAV